MDELQTVLVCGALHAVAWCAGGAFYGGLVRVLGYWRNRIPETTGERAVLVGLKRGASIGLVLGFLWGSAVGYLEEPDDVEELAAWVLVSTFMAGTLAVLALLVGAFALGLEWLGTSPRQEQEL